MATSIDNNSIVTAPKNGKVPDPAAVLTPDQQHAWKQWLVVLALILSDILLASSIWGIAAYIAYSVSYNGPLSDVAIASIVPTVIVWGGMRWLLGLYPGYGLAPQEELRRQTYSVLSTLAITAVLALGIGAGVLLSRLLIGISFLGLLFLGPLVRHFVKWGLAKAGHWGKPIVIVGAGKTSAQLIQTFRREWSLGYKPVAIFDFRLAPRGKVLEGVPHGGTVIDAIELAREQKIDSIIFAMPQVRRQYLARFVDRASLYFRDIFITPNLSGVVTSVVTAKDFSGIFGLEIRQTLLEPWPRRAKRALDLLGAVVGGLLIIPLLLAIAVCIKLDSPGPVFFKQVRPGAQGRSFFFWKFRTMYPDAERRLTELLRDEPDLRTEWEKGYKLRVDPRITRIGRFLRKTSLDELPQLWNVARGEMSLVGPRPILTEEVSKYGEVYGLYQRVRPGITGLWQVSGRSDTSYTERVDMAAYYVRNWSVWLDIIILARTVKSVVLRRGAI